MRYVHRSLLPCVFLIPLAVQAQFTASLTPETNRAFDEYVSRMESKMDWRARLAGNDISIQPSVGKSPIDVPDGMIHDWTASVLIPNTTTDKAIHVFQSYADYKTMFGPEVIESKLLAHDGHHWKTFLRLRRKKVVTAVLDSEYDVEYRPLGDGRWAILSRSTRISELDRNQEVAAGQGHGYLWRLNAYWLLEPRPGGIYLECRSISLTRDIPPGLGWMVKPLVTSLPKESLQSTLEAARTALR
jgi:hypothetical protein